MRARALGITLLLLLMFSLTGTAQNLDVRLNGNQLYFSSPGLRFISGDALRRLRDGAIVSFVFQLGTSTSRVGTPKDLVTVRFAVSYDLWEEKFAVTRSGAAPRSVSNLTQEGAEKWCIDALTLPAPAASDESFWVMLSYREEEPPAEIQRSRSGFSLGGMVEIFSQRNQDRSPGRKEITAGPFRLSDLRKKKQ